LNQRHLAKVEVLYVLHFGRRLYNAGVLMVFLGKRDIPLGDQHDASVTRLEGTAVLVDASSGLILTVYRNKAALKEHRKKPKYNRHKRIA